jgi:hypothetical protein
VYERSPGGHPTVNYFVDRFPLFLAAPVPGAAPVVTFGFVDPGTGNRSGFTTYLAAYQGLFSHLKSFRLLYIAPRATEFRRAEERFRLTVKEPLESGVGGEILRYFEIRRKWEKNGYLVPVTADLEFLNEARRRFQADRFESLYQGWTAGRIAERELRSELSQLAPQRTVLFDTYLVRNKPSPLDERHRNGMNGSQSEQKGSK